MDKTSALDALLNIYSFKNELGEVITFVPGQREIMAAILNLGVAGKRFVQIEAATQFGKSSAVAAALVMRCTKEEKWAIVAGTSEKAQIIMNYFIDYVAENSIARKLLQTATPIERLQQERNKRHLIFMSGFEVQVFSADSHNRRATGNAIMGQNAPFVILDEAALVDDQIESKIFRMIAGFSKTKHLYVKVGNPFYRNHFLKSHNDSDFHLIKIDWQQGVKEGRFTADYIEKARQRPNFDVLFEVKFPSADAVDLRGWSPLLTEEDIERCFVVNGQGFGFLKVGCDPAGEGTNFNVIVGRYRNYAKILLRERVLDQFRFTEFLVNWRDQIRNTEGILPLGYWVDRIGIGEGYYQTMRTNLEGVFGVNVGQEAQDRENFVNQRAEVYWRLREMIKSGQLQLEKDNDWLQLAQIKYRTRLEGRKGKVEIMSKEEMRANGIESPDCADALALTFCMADPVSAVVSDLVDKKDELFDRYGLFAEI